MNRLYRPVAVALVALIVLAGIGLAACKQTTDALATVNGVAIPKSEVDTQLARVARQQQTTLTADASQTYRANILESLIQVELIRQQAKTLGVAVTTQQVDDYLAMLEAQYGGQTNFESAIKQSGLTVATIRDSITTRLLTNAVMANVAPTSTITVSDADVSAYYAANKAEFAAPAQVHATHILISATDTVLAQRVFAQAKGGANLAQLATKYSQDAGSAKSGGDLGWAASGNYVPEFKNAVDKMKVGSFVLVKSQFGWHVIKLLGRRPAQTQPLSEVSPQIEQTLIQQSQTTAFTKYVAALRSKADIVITDAALKKLIDATLASTATPSPTP
jgi:parvulin-like peptidyl-prolyl isomerase